jgi:hypothetical protein
VFCSPPPPSTLIPAFETRRERRAYQQRLYTVQVLQQTLLRLLPAT